MTAAPQSSQPKAERLRHVCPEVDCIYYGKPTTPGACGCHRTADQMMLARIHALEGALLEVNGCFEAAYAEGLSERLAEADQNTGTLADLFYRRLVFAHHAGIAALSPKPAGETE